MRALKRWRRSQSAKEPGKKRRPRKPIDWRTYKTNIFLRQHRQTLQLKFQCNKCKRPLSERMQYCPWCGHAGISFRSTKTFPAYCARCEHGIHNDWRFCPWCFRERFKNISSKPSVDKRYTEHCTNPRCRKPMMTFMRYCPYCHKKVARPWKHPKLSSRCPSCRWSIAKDYWDFCAWCGIKIV